MGTSNTPHLLELARRLRACVQVVQPQRDAPLRVIVQTETGDWHRVSLPFGDAMLGLFFALGVTEDDVDMPEAA